MASEESRLPPFGAATLAQSGETECPVNTGPAQGRRGLDDVAQALHLAAHPLRIDVEANRDGPAPQVLADAVGSGVVGHERDVHAPERVDEASQVAHAGLD